MNQPARPIRPIGQRIAFATLRAGVPVELTWANRR